MREFHKQIFKCIVGSCDETCSYYHCDDKGNGCCNSSPIFTDSVCKYFKNIDKIREDLKYYADVNAELGIVHIPKFVIEKMIESL